jgi:hypothetical protein
MQCDLYNKTPFQQCTACTLRKRTYKNIPRLPCFLSGMLDAVFFRAGKTIDHIAAFASSFAANILGKDQVGQVPTSLNARASAISLPLPNYRKRLLRKRIIADFSYPRLQARHWKSTLQSSKSSHSTKSVVESETKLEWSMSWTCHHTALPTWRPSGVT